MEKWGRSVDRVVWAIFAPVSKALYWGVRAIITVVAFGAFAVVVIAGVIAVIAFFSILPNVHIPWPSAGEGGVVVVIVVLLVQLFINQQREKRHLLYAALAAYLGYRDWHEGEGALVMCAAIFGFEVAAFVACKWPKHFAE
jgi:hypothetical protein